MSWNPAFIGPDCLLRTVVDFLIGRQLDRTSIVGRRRVLLLTSVTANLGLLAVFKYANFFQDNRGGPRNSDSLLRWDPDPGEGVWHATEETELSG